MPDIVDRSKQIRQIVEKNPGITSKEIAETMDVTPGYVCQIVGMMRDKEEIRQKRNERGVGLHLSDSAMRRKLIRERWK